MATDHKLKSEFEGVVSLADLVQHQSGAVISRTIIKKSTGTVTAFAFDAGEGLSEHTAAFDALIIGVEGEATITVAGDPFQVSAGQVLRLPAGTPHSLTAMSPFKMLLVMIRE
ncbi:MAG: cupin domain-containing protein [Candidatus Binatia bacterium]